MPETFTNDDDDTRRELTLNDWDEGMKFGMSDQYYVGLTF